MRLPVVVALPAQSDDHVNPRNLEARGVGVFPTVMPALGAWTVRGFIQKKFLVPVVATE
jgi:hypothetical protein